MSQPPPGPPKSWPPPRSPKPRVETETRSARDIASDVPGWLGDIFITWTFSTWRFFRDHTVIAVTGLAIALVGLRWVAESIFYAKLGTSPGEVGFAFTQALEDAAIVSTVWAVAVIAVAAVAVVGIAVLLAIGWVILRFFLGLFALQTRYSPNDPPGGHEASSAQLPNQSLPPAATSPQPAGPASPGDSDPSDTPWPRTWLDRLRRFGRDLWGIRFAFLIFFVTVDRPDPPGHDLACGGGARRRGSRRQTGGSICLAGGHPPRCPSGPSDRRPDD